MVRRKGIIILALFLATALLLSACGGTKDAAGVVTDIEKLSGKLESYHAEGTMVLNTGQEPQVYGVAVSYQTPEYYRISLTNESKNITQIVLRNDDGVFVLTPHLNKSFRFQSDWPKNQGQVYLFQTLVQSIIDDEQRQFAAEEKAYVFDVMANYQNASLVRQKIWLNKDNYAPQRVIITDGDANEMVAVTFKVFEFNKNFDDDWFDMKRNMTGISIQSLPVMGGKSEKQAAPAGAGQQQSQSFGIVYPGYVPANVNESAPSEIRLGDSNAIMIRYTGDYNYTIVETRAKEEQMVINSFGTVVDVDLGETVGVLIGDAQRTLMWTHEGVDYRLSSGDLPYEEMVKVAKSVFGQVGK